MFCNQKMMKRKIWFSYFQRLKKVKIKSQKEFDEEES